MANLTAVLDMVKVMAFALQEGKIAVHCHAGLGRTGKSQEILYKMFPLSQENLMIHLQNLTQVCCWHVSWPMLPR